MINPQWLELPMSRTIFQGPKNVRAIEIQLYRLTGPEYIYAQLFIMLIIVKFYGIITKTIEASTNR